MYTSFFGFKEKPFNLTPDARYLFLSPHHKEALDHLLYGINERKGFIAITGGVGTGKTTLCRTMLSHLDTSTKSALIFNSFISDNELLKTVIQEFGIEMGQEIKSKKDNIDVLTPPMQSDGLDLGGIVTFANPRLFSIDTAGGIPGAESDFEDYLGITGDIVVPSP